MQPSRPGGRPRRTVEEVARRPGTPPTATYDPPGLVFYDLDGTRLLLDRAAPSALGPAGTDEWMAFVRDSEGNLVGLVEHRPRA